LRSTALMLETQALTMSTPRSAIIGSENTALAKVSAANSAPTAEPMPSSSTSAQRSPASSGISAYSIMPARDQTRSITSNSSANTPACPTTRPASVRECLSAGTFPRSRSRLTEYRPTASSGATNTKPDNSTDSNANRPSHQANAEIAMLTNMITTP